jgi:HEAT repeat protein
MRLPRFRFRIRTLLLLVAFVAVALVAQRIYLDGPDAHWIVLKLRYGNAETRRSAALQARESEHVGMFHAMIDAVFSTAGSQQTSQAQRRRGRRRAELLLPALCRAAGDPDAGCRASALSALNLLACLYGSKTEKSVVLRQIIAATRDRDGSVRTAAVLSLAGLANCETGAVIDAIRSALADPSVEVRQAAARELGILGATVPETQADVASILIPLLASREDARVRVQAASGMCYFGTDSRRRPAGAGPDVVPALVAVLDDSDVDVRRTSASVLALTTFAGRGRKLSAWDRRKDSIIPALKKALADADKAVREESALALFAFGEREGAVIELIEQAVGDPGRSQKSDFELALKVWQGEREAKDAIGSGGKCQQEFRQFVERQEPGCRLPRYCGIRTRGLCAGSNDPDQRLLRGSPQARGH